MTSTEREQKIQQCKEDIKALQKNLDDLEKQEKKEEIRFNPGDVVSFYGYFRLLIKIAGKLCAINEHGICVADDVDTNNNYKTMYTKVGRLEKIKIMRKIIYRRN